MDKIWFVMPVYYDTTSFITLKKKIEAKYPQAKFVVLDDSAGADPSVSPLKGEKNLRWIEPPFNLGHQRGLVYALRILAPEISAQDVVVTMDSDGEDRPEDIEDLIRELKVAKDPKHSVALVQRSRRQERRAFKVFYFFYKLAFRWLTGTVIRSGNFAGYYGSFLKNYIKHPNFDLCYSSTLVNLKVEKKEIQRPRGLRIQGTSKMNFMSLVMHGIRMLMPFMDQIAIRSLFVFASLFTASLGFSFVVVGIKFLTDEAIPGWASSILMLSLLLSFVALGNFLVLFSIFSQTQGLAMSRLEEARQEDEPKLKMVS